MQFRFVCMCCAKLASRAKAKQRKGRYELSSQHKSFHIMGCAVEAGGLVTPGVT